MIRRLPRTLTAFLAAAVLAVSSLAVATAPSLAGETPTYSKAAFDKAQAAGKHIVIEVFKKGCPTCKLQQPGLTQAKEKYPNAAFFKVDFENDAAPVERFQAVKQSTLIVFKGSNEVGRVVGETDAGAIVKLVDRGA